MTGGRRTVDTTRLLATALSLLLALSVAGCVTYTGGASGGPDAPLRARLGSTFELSARQPTLHFAVSDRAHVALFRVSSSGYVRALYPYHPGGSSLFGPGPQTLYVEPFVRPSSFRISFGSPYSLHPASAHRIGRPELSFVLLVASRGPLRLSRIRNDVPFRFRPASPLGSPLQGGSAFGTMDRLLARLIPAGMPADDWAVDWTYTSVGAPRRPLLLRRIAVRAGPDSRREDETRDEESEQELLDTDDVPFDPPLIPADLPEVELDGREADRFRVPVSPLAGVPERRVPPRPVEEDGLSEHFGRLFGDGREGAVSWRPAPRRPPTGRPFGPSGSEWRRRPDEWASNPGEHAFPNPRRPPRRWDGPGRAQPAGGRIGGIGRAGDPRHRIRRPRVDIPRTPADSRGSEVDGGRVGGSGGGGGSPGDSGSDGTRHEDERSRRPRG